ncbi:MAG: KH domain-containing protein [Firmicutes bacterium]|jgi:hypothetical protein|nr:KH domain-containing protein [Bacillota bacterium]
MTQTGDTGAPLFAEPQFTPAESEEDVATLSVAEDDVADIPMTEADTSVLAVDEDADEPDPNLIPGGRSKDVLEFLARQLVEDPDAVEVDVVPAKVGAKLLLKVAPEDMGRMIGRKGRVIQAVRVVVRAAAARDKTDAVVEIVD